MKLDELKTLITGELVCRLREFWRVKWTTDQSVSFVDARTETHTIYLRFGSTDTPAYIRHAYRSFEDGWPEGNPLRRIAVHSQVISIPVHDSETALETATMYADRYFKDAVIVDWYEQSSSDKFEWRVILARIYDLGER